MKLLFALLIVSTSLFQTKDSNIIKNAQNDTISSITTSKGGIASDYKILYENANSDREKLTSLLETAFTIIIAVIIAIIGSSFFYNYRFNKKEFELLNKESKIRLDEAQKEVLEKNEKTIETIISKMDSEIQSRFEQLTDNNKTNIDTIKESLGTILSTYKSELDKEIEDFKAEIKVIKEEYKNRNELLEKELTRNDKDLKKEIYDLRGDVYAIKGWNSLALSYYVQQALLCIELNQKWQIEYIAGDIVSMLQASIEKLDTIASYDRDNIEKLLKDFPTHLVSEKRKIEELYPKLKVREPETPRPQRVDLLSLFRQMKK
jgi:hypothetical protein